MWLMLAPLRTCTPFKIYRRWPIFGETLQYYCAGQTTNGVPRTPRNGFGSSNFHRCGPAYTCQSEPTVTSYATRVSIAQPLAYSSGVQPGLLCTNRQAKACLLAVRCSGVGIRHEFKPTRIKRNNNDIRKIVPNMQAHRRGKLSEFVPPYPWNFEIMTSLSLTCRKKSRIKFSSRREKTILASPYGLTPHQPLECLRAPIILGIFSRFLKPTFVSSKFN